jgi:hypothetical protein
VTRLNMRRIIEGYDVVLNSNHGSNDSNDDDDDDETTAERAMLSRATSCLTQSVENIDEVKERLESLTMNSSKFKLCCISSVAGIVAFYFVVNENVNVLKPSSSRTSNSSTSTRAASPAPKFTHWIQLHSINGGVSGNQIYPAVDEIQLNSEVLAMQFVGGGNALSITTLHGGIEIRHVPNLQQFVCVLESHKPNNAVAAADAEVDGTQNHHDASTNAGATHKLDWIATSMDFAPNSHQPGLFGFGDKYGGVHLIGLEDLQEYAKHMPIRHHRSGLRLAAHSLKTGLKTKTKGIASSTKAAISEAKYLVKDVKEKGLLKGVMGFFGQ